MHHTPSDKGQLSSCLKERLKRCGRYHASPTLQPSENKKKSRSHEVNTPEVPGSSPEYSAKRFCSQFHKSNKTPIKSDADPVDTDLMSPGCSSYDLISDNIHLDQDKSSDPVLTDLPLDITPSFQRRKSDVFRLKGSKLSFEGEVNSREESDTNVISCNIHKQSNDAHVIDSDDHCNYGDTKSRSQMIKELTLKEEELRKLRMVKMYRSKNNLSELQTLIDKWREVSQQAVQDLHEAMSQPKPTLTELINHLGIEHELIRFSTENDEENFY